MRYELHRVWVVEGTLKPGQRHVYGKRTFYLDEDSWSVLAEDAYDTRGGLWRASLHGLMQAYDAQVPWYRFGIYHDLNSGGYMVGGLDNEIKEPIQFNVKGQGRRLPAGRAAAARRHAVTQRAEGRQSMPWTRALLAWLVIIVAESIHGTLRPVPRPAIGDLPAVRPVCSPARRSSSSRSRLSRWLGAARRTVAGIGALWVVLTVAFEVALGRGVFHYDWSRILGDYDLSQGGLMGFGLLAMLFMPLLAARSAA